MPAQIKIVYDKPLKEGGFRVLVDRLWPRGLSREVDLWVKEIAPSDSLRNWFAHDPAKWNEFRKRYFSELDNKRELFSMISGKPGLSDPPLWGQGVKVQQRCRLKGIPKKEVGVSNLKIKVELRGSLTPNHLNTVTLFNSNLKRGTTIRGRSVHE